MTVQKFLYLVNELHIFLNNGVNFITLPAILLIVILLGFILLCLFVRMAKHFNTKYRAIKHRKNRCPVYHGYYHIIFKGDGHIGIRFEGTTEREHFLQDN